MQPEYYPSADEKAFFWSQGYLHISGLFSRPEANAALNAVRAMRWFQEKGDELSVINSQGDYGGGFASLAVTNSCQGDDIFSRMGRSYKILDRASFLYDDDVYCYHNKIVAKHPGVKGFMPHQDYGGYWINMGIKLPDPHTCFIALEDQFVDSGCLQLLPKSHLLGPLPHDAPKADSGILQDVWNSVLERGYVAVPFELKAGDALLFHGNTVHLSGTNIASVSRVALIVTLNTKRSSPDPQLNYTNHPAYSPTPRVYTNFAPDSTGAPNPFVE